MKLFINGRFLTQQTSGVQQFARDICRELTGVIPFTILVPQFEILRDDEFASHIKPIGLLKGHLWEQTDLPYFILKHKHAVLLNLCNTGPLLLRNQIYTLHDVAFLNHPEWFHSLFVKWYSFLVPRLLHRSKHVVTVSDAIKLELNERFPTTKDKIHVIGNKVSTVFLNATPRVPQKFSHAPGSFYLMVGSQNPRKNFEFVTETFAKQGIQTPLVIAGGSHKAFRSKQSHNHATVTHLNYVTTEELKWLYQHARALINPSLYEGFGIPNLEAFSQHCPVICSDIPAFREVCGSAVTYFDPQNPESLLGALENASATSDQRREAGFERFNSYQLANRTEPLVQFLNA